MVGEPVKPPVSASNTSHSSKGRLVVTRTEPPRSAGFVDLEEEFQAVYEEFKGDFILGHSDSDAMTSGRS